MSMVRIRIFEKESSRLLGKLSQPGRRFTLVTLSRHMVPRFGFPDDKDINAFMTGQDREST